VSARLVVIGGGLAGIAAALRLAERGHAPLLIETRKKLGGRATSFLDPRNQQTLDNCQHVVMGCCTNLLDLYARFGVLDEIEWHDTLYWSRGGGEVDRVSPGRLPPPFHFAGALERMRFLEKDDRRSIRRAMWRLIRGGPNLRVAWAGRTFREFLDSLEATPHALARFWNPIITSACNIVIDRCDAGYAIQVFQDGFLGSRFGAALGLPRVPLSALYDPAVEKIEALGGDVVDGISAKALAFDGARVTGVVTQDGVINCSAVVNAVPPDRLDKMVSDTMRRADSRLQKLDRFQWSPILGIHLWFDQVIMDLPHMVCIDPSEGVQWLFNKSSLRRGHPVRDSVPRQHIHAVISAADAWMDLIEEDIIAKALVDVHRFLPRARGLQPVEARTVKEKHATFAAVPGVDAIRPGAVATGMGLGGGGIANLFLAGDWCDTGWPATMEGAVRSGYAAAAAIAGDLSLRPLGSLPNGWLARMLGLKDVDVAR
jgi:zeta-carotene desaturase